MQGANRQRFVFLSSVALAAIVILLAAGIRRSRAQSLVAQTLQHVRLPKRGQRHARARYWALRRGLQFGVPKGAYADAVARMRAMEASAASSTASPSTTWTFIGPQPIKDAQPNFAEPIPGGANYDATGRVTSVAVDPVSGDIFVGAASGGVWRSAGDGSMFAPITDLLPTQVIGAIAIDSKTNPSTIYVATGEANASGDSYYGQGIFRSTDLGASWSALGPPGTFDRVSFAKLAIDNSHEPQKPPTIFAAAARGFIAGRADPDFGATDPTKAGLWRSTDGGKTWGHYSAGTFGCGMKPAPSKNPCSAKDVAIDPNGPNSVYVSIEFAGLFHSIDGGKTWLPVPECFINGLACVPPGLNNLSRVSVAIAKLPPETVYAMVGAPDGNEYVGFFKSTDGGLTWTRESVPSFGNGGVAMDGTNPNNFSQSDYDQALLIDPSDSTGDTVIFGGVGIYESTDSGADWSFLAQNGGTHSDQHALTIASDNDTAYLGNDGGAFSFKLSQISGGIASFTSLNATIGAAQIQGIGPHPTDDNKAIAGTQDNGTVLFTGSPGWESVETGDAGFALFDQSDPNFAYHTFASDPLPELSMSTDGGNTWDSVDPTNSIDDLIFSGTDPGPGFYPPLASDPAVKHRVLFGTHFIYVSTDGMSTWQQQEKTDLTGGCQDGTCALQDIEFAPSDHSRAWALSMQALSENSTVPFRLFRTTQANLDSGARWTDVTANTHVNAKTNQATGIAVDPNNANVAWLSISGFKAVTRTGHIFRTTNFGSSWTKADGKGKGALPDVPVLRVLVDRTDVTGKTAYAATDIGVFRTTDAGNSWQPFNVDTIPAVPVFDIEQNQNGLIFAGTHGRGAFSIPAPPPPPLLLFVTPATIDFGSAILMGSHAQTIGPRTVTVLNARTSTQNRPVRIAAISTSGDFAIKHNGCPQNLAPGAKCSISVTFTPTLPQPRTGSLTLADTATNSPQAVSLSGTGVQGIVAISPTSISFANQKQNTRSTAKTVKLTNHNPIPTGIQSIGLGGTDLTDFLIAGKTCGKTLGANASCTISVAFKPKAAGTFMASLLIADDAAGSPQAVPLAGTGI
jgi:hypothetical protein